MNCCEWDNSAYNKNDTKEKLYDLWDFTRNCKIGAVIALTSDLYCIFYKISDIENYLEKLFRKIK